LLDVFISYPRRNRDQVLVIKRLLDARGLEVFFDVEGGVDGGDVYTDVVDKRLREAKAVLGVWTPYALTRDWIKTECHIAKDQGKLVVAEIERISQDEVPALFYQVNREDLTDFKGDVNHPAWRRLENTLAKRFVRWAELHSNDPEAKRALEKAAMLRAEDLEAAAPSPPPAPPPSPPPSPSQAQSPLSTPIPPERLGLYLQIGGAAVAVIGLLMIASGGG
jgi:hypothetical protein